MTDITNCDSAFHGGPRPIWDSSVYQVMKEKYVQVVGQENSSIDLSSNSKNESFIPPWEVKEAPGKGRGLFASTNISKGDPLWDTKSHAVFRNEQDFIRFLDLIGYDMACEILQWAYTEECLNGDGNVIEDCYNVGVELGEGSLMNTVNARQGQVPNVGWCNIGLVGKSLKKYIGCDDYDDTTYAVRDIQKGEEILSDYRHFDYDGELEWFDRLNELAWEDDDDDSYNSDSSDSYSDDETEDDIVALEF